MCIRDSLKCVTINVRTMNDTGKAKFVLERLSALSADVAFIQETRLTDKFDFAALDGYHIAAAPATGGQGGLLIVIRQDKLFKFEGHKAVSPRVLLATLHVADLRVQLLCLHAPTAESPAEAHDAFAEHVSVAFACCEKNDIIVVGTDLNARLAGLDELFACVGTQAVSACPENACFRHSCLHLFDRYGLQAVNTVFSEPGDETWKHPLGTVQQIDYLLLPKKMVDNGKVLDCRTGEWAYFDCTTTSDHRHVQVTVMLESCTVRQRKNPRVKKA
eukprot:386254-Amphidinium_carterae.1